MRLLTSLAITACVGAMAFAGEPLGTASSSTGFELNGVATRSDGIASWPLVAGDEIRSGGSSVTIRFQDGSRMTIGEQSRVKLVQNGDAVGVNLTSGEAQFSLTQESKLQVSNLGRQVSARSGAISAITQAGVSQTSGPRADAPRKPPPPVSTK